MNRFALSIDDDAGMIDGSGAGIELDIADETGAFPQGAARPKHRLEPAGKEDQIVVEQDEIRAAGQSGRAIVGAGVAEVALVENDAKRRGQGGKPLARAIGAAVVNEYNLMPETGR